MAGISGAFAGRFRGGHAQRPNATALGERPSCGHAVERKADMTSDERVHLVRCGPERNVGHARAGGAHEQNHTKMRRGAVAARAVINLAVFPLQIGNQLRDVVNGQFVPDDRKLGNSTTGEIGAKSFSVSYGNLERSEGWIAWVLTEPISKVWPSFDARATSPAAMLPPAPPRFSITTGTPYLS